MNLKSETNFFLGILSIYWWSLIVKHLYCFKSLSELIFIQRNIIFQGFISFCSSINWGIVQIVENNRTTFCKLLETPELLNCGAFLTSVEIGFIVKSETKIISIIWKFPFKTKQNCNTPKKVKTMLGKQQLHWLGWG